MQSFFEIAKLTMAFKTCFVCTGKVMETTKYESVPQTTKSQDSESNGLKSEVESTENGYQFPKRFILALLLFSGWFVIYCLRVCLSVAIVAMTNNSTKKLHLPNTANYQV